MSRDFGFLPIPKHLQYDPERTRHFGIATTSTFALATAFTAANVYYCQPLLIQLSRTFDVDYNEVSRLSTLVQGGYGAGLLLISPLGDLVRRRPLVLLLVFVTTLLTIGLSFTKSLVVFEILSFFVGMFSVVPQVLIPLTADLVEPERRASALAIVFAGLDSGILYARVIGGVIGEYAPPKVVYYAAIGLQGAVLFTLWALVPDYPAKNPELTYFRILKTMGTFVVSEPVLLQASVVLLLASACYSAFWVTLTFLLGGSPYFWSTLGIGLFGLIGLVGVAIAPFTGRLIDRLLPWYATLAGVIGYMLFQAIQVGAGGIHIAALVIACIGLDLFFTMTHISLATVVFGIEPAARARLNAVLIISIFIGQTIGSSASTVLFTKYGWRIAAGFSLGLMGLELLVLLARGPRCQRKTWFGYEVARDLPATTAPVVTPDVEKTSSSNATTAPILNSPQLPREGWPSTLVELDGTEDLDS